MVRRMDEDNHSTAQSNIVKINESNNQANTDIVNTKTITDKNGNTFEANIPETTAQHMKEREEKLSGIGEFFATICTISVVMTITMAIVFVIDTFVYKFGGEDFLKFIVWEIIGIATPLLSYVITGKKIGCMLWIIGIGCFCIGFYHLFLIFKTGWFISRVQIHLIVLAASMLSAVISASFVE